MKIILGAGMSGLAAGISSQLPVLEANHYPGGICTSYYMRPGDAMRYLSTNPEDPPSYRFEFGGGHWIFGGETLISQFISSLVDIRSYSRISSVFFSDRMLFVPYPIQHHVKVFGLGMAAKALFELVKAKCSKSTSLTMAESLRDTFGPTLCELFFEPFHERYTVGLWRKVAPMDLHKSPINLFSAVRGAFGATISDGYNQKFIYPTKGLDTLARKMAERCDVHYGKQVVSIDLDSRRIVLGDGSELIFEMIISTLPLNQMMGMTGLEVTAEPDPYTSVLVVNIGALRGTYCPKDHWVYVPHSRSGFHRVGFYSNVDTSFLPSISNAGIDLVSLYVEKAYMGGRRPSDEEIENFCADAIGELQGWGWITDVQVHDSTWIDVAYTWSWPNSDWVSSAIRMLEEHKIYQVGRYGRWRFQGIASSIHDGLSTGKSI